MGLQVFDRVNPLRKPKGFEPVVQRWSAGFANKCETLCVAFHGIQGRMPRASTRRRSSLDRDGDRPSERTDGA